MFRYENCLRETTGSHPSLALLSNFMGTMSHMAIVLPHCCGCSKAGSQRSDSSPVQRARSQEDAPSPELTLYLTPFSYHLLHFPSFTAVSFSEAACLILSKTKA